jgi:hypothetical protein
MRKTFLLYIIFLSAYSLNAQSAKNVYDNQQLKNNQVLSSVNSTDNYIDNLVVYPNPVTDVLKISFKSDKKCMANVSLFNNIGKQVFSQESLVDLGNNLILIDVRSKAIEPGIYFVQCLFENKIFTRKLILK